MIIFLIVPFFFIGSIAYLLCVAVPRLRRFAMPSSLWLLSLCVGFFLWVSILFGFAIGRELWNTHAPQLHLWNFNAFTLPQTKAFTAAYIIVLTATSLTLASVITAIHQVVIHRLTLALFRLYVAAVSLGVGIVFFLSTFLILAANVPNSALQATAMIIGLIAAIACASSFAIFCCRRPSQFRGDFPSNFTFVSRDEFEQAK